MRVKKTTDMILGMNQGISVEAKHNGTGLSQSFERQFHEQGKEAYERYLSELSKKIDSQAEVLVKKASLVEFEKYRRLISELIYEVVNNAYAFTKENIVDARGRRRTFALVSTIDKKLDEMAALILTQNAQSIELICKVDDIRGMILDLTM